MDIFVRPRSHYNVVVGRPSCVWMAWRRSRYYRHADALQHFMNGTTSSQYSPSPSWLVDFMFTSMGKCGLQILMGWFHSWLFPAGEDGWRYCNDTKLDWCICGHHLYISRIFKNMSLSLEYWHSSFNSFIFGNYKNNDVGIYSRDLLKIINL